MMNVNIFGYYHHPNERLCISDSLQIQKSNSNYNLLKHNEEQNTHSCQCKEAPCKKTGNLLRNLIL